MLIKIKSYAKNGENVHSLNVEKNDLKKWTFSPFLAKLLKGITISNNLFFQIDRNFMVYHSRISSSKFAYSKNLKYANFGFKYMFT